MSKTVAGLRERVLSEGGRKAGRYALGSVVALLVSEITLVALLGPAGWTATSASITACIAGGIPSYYLNRRWVWRRSGRSHLRREVVPFWALALGGLVLSTWWARLAEAWTKTNVESRALQVGLIVIAATSAAAVLWVIKFVIFNKLMFVDREP